MDGLSLKAFCLGDLFNNCYLIFHDKSKKGFIIDSPAPTNEIKDFIRSQSLEIDFIALTHAHFDHISGLESYCLPFYLHKEDFPLLKDPQLNGSAFFTSPVVIENEPRLYKDNEPLYFQSYPIEIIHTPGHTPGSVSLKLGKWLFSGDTLFSGSVGRVDLPGGSFIDLQNSIRKKLFTLPKKIIVHPGHGPDTTIGREKNSNPFINIG